MNTNSPLGPARSRTIRRRVRPDTPKSGFTVRAANKISTTPTKVEEPVKELTLGAAGVPLLAVAKAFDHPQLSPVSDWMVSNFANREDAWEQRGRYRALHPLRSSPSARLFYENKEFRAWANTVVRHADFGIQAVEVKMLEQKVMRPVFRPAASGAGRTSATEERRFSITCHSLSITRRAIQR